MAQILLVDDDHTVRTLLCLMLEREGHTVVQGTNGVEALERLRDHPIDLVITDLVMPEKEGLETIIEVRKNYPWLKVIAISGGGTGSSKTYLNLAKRLGAECVLRKPFFGDDLLREIRSVLAQV
jgi:CheY-like chemotaxis protein